MIYRVYFTNTYINIEATKYREYTNLKEIEFLNDRDEIVAQFNLDNIVGFCKFNECLLSKEVISEKTKEYLCGLVTSEIFAQLELEIRNLEQHAEEYGATDGYVPYKQGIKDSIKIIKEMYELE